MPGILVVEDDENLNRGITFSLKKSGYEVFSAESVKNGKIIVENEIKGKDITVYDEKGRIVSKRVVQKVREEIELPSGIYIVKTFSTHEKVLL